MDLRRIKSTQETVRWLENKKHICADIQGQHFLIYEPAGSIKVQTQKVLSTSLWSCWPVFRTGGWLSRGVLGIQGSKEWLSARLFSSCFSLSCNRHPCVRVFITQSSQAAKHSWENQPALSPDRKLTLSSEGSESVTNSLRRSDVARATGEIKRT